MDTRAHLLRGRRGGFTLVELLVVVALVGLLVALLVPSLMQAKEQACSVLCQSNLKQLWSTLHNGPAGRPMSLPSPSGWVSHVFDRGAAAAVKCPKDEGDSTSLVGLEGVYIDHFHTMSVHLHAYLTDVLEPGAPLGSGTFTQIEVKRVSDTVKEVYLFGSNGLRITLGSAIVIEAIPHPQWYRCNTTSTNSSTHNLMRGDELLMHMLGVDNLAAAEPSSLVLGSATISYGMNNQVPRTARRPGQTLLLDYSKSIVDIDGAGNMDDDLGKTLAPRHLGRANVLAVDGNVRGMFPWQLDRAEEAWKP